MKKDKILKSSLSTLLKRFSNTDIISDLSKEYSLNASNVIPLDRLKDNHILENVRVSESSISKSILILNERRRLSSLFVKKNENEFEVIYPRSLYIAAKRIGLENINAFILDINDEDMLFFLTNKLLEDKDANIIEMAVVFNYIKEDYHYTQKEIASAINLSRSQVTNIVRLIKMPKDILSDMADGKLSFGHVRAISTLNDKEKHDVVEAIYKDDLSVHEVEKIVFNLKHHINKNKYEDKVSAKYKCKVSSSTKQVTLSFENQKDKQEFLRKISHK